MRQFLALAGIMLILAGCATKLHPQDEDQAIATINLFLKALVQGKYTAAYEEYVSTNIKQQPGMSLEEFISGFKSLLDEHGQITKARFDSYQAVPKKNEIQLYYKITHEKSGEIIYHFVLAGHSELGYKISMIDVGNQMTYLPKLGKNKVPERKRKSGVIEVQLK